MSVGVFGAAVLLPQAEEPAAVVTEVKKAAPAPVSPLFWNQPPRFSQSVWIVIYDGDKLKRMGDIGWPTSS